MANAFQEARLISASACHLFPATIAAKFQIALLMKIALEADPVMRIQASVIAKTHLLLASFVRKLLVALCWRVAATTAATAIPQRATANAFLLTLVHSVTLSWKKVPTKCTACRLDHDGSLDVIE